MRAQLDLPHMAPGTGDLLGNDGCGRRAAAHLAARNVPTPMDPDGDGSGIEVGLQHDAREVRSPLTEKFT